MEDYGMGSVDPEEFQQMSDFEKQLIQNCGSKQWENDILGGDQDEDDTIGYTDLGLDPMGFQNPLMEQKKSGMRERLERSGEGKKIKEKFLNEKKELLALVEQDPEDGKQWSLRCGQTKNGNTLSRRDELLGQDNSSKYIGWNKYDNLLVNVFQEEPDACFAHQINWEKWRKSQPEKKQLGPFDLLEVGKYTTPTLAFLPFLIGFGFANQTDVETAGMGFTNQLRKLDNLRHK